MYPQLLKFLIVLWLDLMSIKPRHERSHSDILCVAFSWLQTNEFLNFPLAINKVYLSIYDQNTCCIRTAITLNKKIEKTCLREFVMTIIVTKSVTWGHCWLNHSSVGSLISWRVNKHCFVQHSANLRPYKMSYKAKKNRDPKRKIQIMSNDISTGTTKQPVAVFSLVYYWSFWAV